MELHLVGGFLGSGKTTAILEAARLLIERGLRVGIITNEQGRHLVDTSFMQASGIPALEVTGGCICCHLDDFEERVEEITAKFDPQVLFAESVGSCTDLVATVLKPLSDFRKTTAQPASLSVFADSRLLLRYLRNQELPFSDAVIYIFEKQIEESELLIANKIDLLSKADAKHLMKLVKEKYPSKTIHAQNSLDSAQIKDWLALIQSKSLVLPIVSLNLDYDAYADGESRFAWVDREFSISINKTGTYGVLSEILSLFVVAITSNNSQIAHQKFYVSDGIHQVRLNFTSLDDPSEKIALELPKLKSLIGSQIALVVNVMVEGDITEVQNALNTVTDALNQKKELSIQETSTFSRVPGYPKPTMRID